MDEFDNSRRRSRRQETGAVKFIAAFLLVAGCFASLFIFQNQGAVWVLWIYGIGLLIAAITGFRLVVSRYRLWLQGQNVQPEQGRGFVPLEVAAIAELTSGPEWSAAAKGHFADSKVVVRYNSGSGCITTVSSTRPRRLPPAAFERVVWFSVEGLRSVVGCKFWGNDGVPILIEFFCGGERTGQIDWGRVRFVEADPQAPRPPIPEGRPISTEHRWQRFEG